MPDMKSSIVVEPMPEGMRLSEATNVFVAGHRGLVGSAILRKLRQVGCSSLLLRTHAELDLRDRAAVDRFFRENRPELVFFLHDEVIVHCPASLQDVVRTRAYLVDMSDAGALARAHREALGEAAPVLTAVGAQLATPGLGVEVEVDAIVAPRTPLSSGDDQL